MKVIIINRDIPFLNASSITRCIDNITEQLILKGVEVHHLGVDQNALKPKSIFENGCHIHLLAVPPGLKIFRNWRMIVQTKKTVVSLNKSHHFDIIDLHESRIGLLLLACRELASVKKIFTFHASAAWERAWDFGYEWQRFVKHFFQRRLRPNIFQLFKKSAVFIPTWLWLRATERYTHARVDKVHTASRFVVKQIFPKNARLKATIIPFGVDERLFTSRQVDSLLFQSIQKQYNGVRFFCLRRLEPRMGLDDLIYAAALIRDRHPDWKFNILIGGKGSIEVYLKKLVAELKIESHVDFCGFIREADLPTWYKACDTFILPTRQLEGFGLVTLEAMSMGLPVIGSSAGATVDILTSAPDAKLFSPGDINHLAFLMETNIENLQLGKKPKANKIRQFQRSKYRWVLYAQSYLNSVADFKAADK